MSSPANDFSLKVLQSSLTLTLAVSYSSYFIYLKTLYTILQRHGQKGLLVLKTVECNLHGILADSLFPFLHSNTHDKWKAQQIKPNSFFLVSFFSLFTHSPLHTGYTNIAFQSRVQLFKTSCSGWSVALDIFRLLRMNVWHGFEIAVW